MKLFLELDMSTRQLRVIPPPGMAIMNQPYDDGINTACSVTFENGSAAPVYGGSWVERYVRQRFTTCDVSINLELKLGGYL